MPSNERSSAVNGVQNRAKKIGTLLLVVLVTLIVGLWINTSAKASRVEEQRRMVVKINGKLKKEARVPGWLAMVTGPDFHTVLDETELVELELNGPEIGDEQLLSLSGLVDLRSITIMGTSVTDSGLQALRNMTKLESVILSYTKVHDLSVLKDMKNLTGLDLLHTSVTDTDLAVLEQIPSLKFVGLGYRKIKGPGISHLTRLPNLEAISMVGAELSDDEMKMLHEVRKLKEINLSQAICSPTALEALKKAFPDLKLVGG